MKKQLPESPTEKELNALQAQWETEGYVFKGNGFLDRDDPPECPMCGETGYFYALWEHPTLTETSTLENGVSFEYSKCHSFQCCYECGYEWIDEPETVEE